MKICNFYRVFQVCWLALLLPGLAVAENQTVIPLAAVNSGAYYIKANLDQKVATEMLFDTGSGYVSLSAQTFAHIKHEPGTVFQRYVTGIMADGKALKVPVYVIAELRLSEHCVLHEVEVAVFKDANRDILGLSALKRIQPLTMQLDPPALTATCG